MTTVVDQVITIFDAVWKGEGAAKSAALSLDSYRKMSADAALRHQHLATKIDSTRSSMMNIAGEMKAGNMTRAEAIKEWERLEGKLGTYEQQAALVTKSQQTLGDRMKGMAATAGQAALVIGGVTLALKGVYEVGRKVYQLAEEGAGINQLYESFNRLNASVMNTPNLLRDMQKETNFTISEVAAMEAIMTLTAGSSAELTKKFADAAPKLAEIAKASNKLNPNLGDTNFMLLSIGRGIKRLEPRLLDNLGLNVRSAIANQRWAEEMGRTVESMTAEEKVMAILNETLRVGANLIEQVGGTVESQVDPYLQLSAATENFTNSFKGSLATINLGQSTLAEWVQTSADESRAMTLSLQARRQGLSTWNEYVKLLDDVKAGTRTYADIILIMEARLSKASNEQREYNKEVARAVRLGEQVRDGWNRAADDMIQPIDTAAVAMSQAVTQAEKMRDAFTSFEPWGENMVVAQERAWNVERAEAARKSIAELIENIRELDAATGDYAMAAINADKESSLFNQTIDEIGEAYVTVGGRTKEQNELLEDMQKAYDKTQKNIRDYSVGIKGVGQEQETVNKRMEGYNEQLAILAPQIEKLKGIQGDVVKVNREATWNQENINQAILDAADGYDANAKELVKFMMGTGDLTDAQAEAVLEQSRMSEAIQEWGKQLAEGVPADEIIADIERVKNAISGMTLTELMGGIDPSKNVYPMLEWMDGDPIVPEIRPIYQRSEEDPEDLVSTLEEIDDTFTSIIEVDGAEESMTTITELLEQLRSVAKTWEAQINISTSGGVPSPGTGNEPEMAFGGPVQQGASYFVGERRPELFVPNQNGYLYPNGTGPGSGTTNIYNYNKDAAAVSMAMLGMRRRQGVDSLAGLA